MAKFKLDEIDHQILNMLIENTRIPFTDVPAEINNFFAISVNGILVLSIRIFSI